MDVRRWLLAAGVLAATASACSSTGAGGADAAVWFDGAYLGACTGNDYTIIPAPDCPATGCLGSEVFAFCEDAAYASCSCDPPNAGGTYIDGGSAPAPTDAGLGGDHHS